MPFTFVLRRSSVVVWDAAMWIGATVLLAFLRFEFSLTAGHYRGIVYYLILAISTQLLVGLILQVYLGRNKLGSFAEVTQLGVLVMLVAI